MTELTKDEQNRLAQIISEEDNNQISKFSWDDSFQTRLVGMLLTDRYFLVQSLDKVKPNYFSKEIHVQIVNFLYSYFDKYKTLPEKWFLKEEISKEYKDRAAEIQIASLAEIEKVYDFYIPGVDTREALIDKITYFAKVQSVKIAFHKCLDKMTKAPEDEATWNYIYDQMRQTMLIDRNYEPGFEYFKNIEEMFERMKKTYEGVDTFTTGFAGIDDALTGGGLQIGNIGAWIALPGTGKSLAMCRASVENVKRGKKVLYITMEMDELGISQRFTSQWVKCDINDLMSNKQRIISHVEAFKEDKLDSNMLIVKQFPGGTMDVNGIKAYYAQLVMRGFKPDLLVVDYVGEMKDDPSLQKYESAYRILRDLRAFGIEQKHCTITCVQPNSSASKLDQGQYIDESNIGTSFDQFKPLDCFWSINQQPIEKDAGVARLFVIKHRNGKSRFPLYVNFDYEMGTLDINEISHESYKQKMNLVNQKKSDTIMDNKDSITKDSNSKGKGKGKKGKSKILFDPTDESNIDTFE
jgi:replicative DNA helicase